MEHIRQGRATDIPRLVELLNNAYRGDSSRKGWTTEADLIAGEIRTDVESVQDVLDIPDSIFLVYEDETGLMGCVNLQAHGKRLYLGMFAVEPETQGKGIGKKLLAAAEMHAREVGAEAIYMVVISLRHELIQWYIRHGYTDTGKRKPFPEDSRTGKHQQELEFSILEKPIS